MTCNTPLRLPDLKRGGSKVVSCGQCFGCRLRRSREWALRSVHEASLYDSNCFITLTFAPAFLPPGGSIDPTIFPDFMKRLRKRIYPAKVRYVHCSEYGTLLDRPHEHALLFGYDFPDKKFLKEEDGYKLFTSDLLSSLWSDPVTHYSLGLCSVGAVTPKSAAYVCHYILDKVTGPLAVDHYGGKHPEVFTMSRRPGIAYEWYKKFGREDVLSGYSIFDGRKTGVPAYYRKKFQQELHDFDVFFNFGVDHPDQMAYCDVKFQKFKRFLTQEAYDADRLAAREEILRHGIEVKRKKL